MSWALLTCYLYHIGTTLVPHKFGASVVPNMSGDSFALPGRVISRRVSTRTATFRASPDWGRWFVHFVRPYGDI